MLETYLQYEKKQWLYYFTFTSTVYSELKTLEPVNNYFQT